MMLYAYGAVRPDQTPPGVKGIDGATVAVLEAAGLGVAVSELANEVEPTRDRLVQHHRVTMALLRSGGVAPFRFGHVFPGEAELRDGLQPRAAELGQKLAALAGCVEMDIRLPLGSEMPSPSLSPREGKGTAYLMAKKRRFQAADGIRASLTDVLEDWRQEIGREGLEVACLVKLASVPELKRRLAEVAPDAVISGPWPAGSFV